MSWGFPARRHPEGSAVLHFPCRSACFESTRGLSSFQPRTRRVIGLVKPDPAIYQLACQRLGVIPEDCRYVGDGGSNELTGADASGMRAVLIAPSYDDATSLVYIEGSVGRSYDYVYPRGTDAAPALAGSCVAPKAPPTVALRKRETRC